MPQNIGTRARQITKLERIDQGHETRSHAADPGLTKRVTSTATFTASNGRITGSNGDFTNFAVGDDLLVQNANLNNGFFHVTGLDATNHAYLVLDPAPANEGPLSVVVRTP